MSLAERFSRRDLWVSTNDVFVVCLLREMVTALYGIFLGLGSYRGKGRQLRRVGIRG